MLDTSGTLTAYTKYYDPYTLVHGKALHEFEIYMFRNETQILLT